MLTRAENTTRSSEACISTRGNRTNNPKHYLRNGRQYNTLVRPKRLRAVGPTQKTIGTVIGWLRDGVVVPSPFEGPKHPRPRASPLWSSLILPRPKRTGIGWNDDRLNSAVFLPTVERRRSRGGLLLIFAPAASGEPKLGRGRSPVLAADVGCLGGGEREPRGKRRGKQRRRSAVQVASTAMRLGTYRATLQVKTQHSELGVGICVNRSHRDLNAAASRLRSIIGCMWL